MNFIFVVVVTVSLIILTINSPDLAFNSLITGATSGFRLAISLLPVYAVWLSLLRLIENTGLSEKITRLFRPIIKKLFKTSSKAENQIALNMTANFLGMGGAGTKAGINAISLMDEGKTYASDDMLMLLIINCTSIQLIPSTIIALRAIHGSVNPADIILPSFVNTLITTLVGVLLAKICRKSTRKGTK